MQNPRRGVCIVHSYIEALHDLLFPPQCLCCEQRLETSRPPLVCSACREGLRSISSPLCATCGIPFATGVDHLCGVCIKKNYFFDYARSAMFYQPPVSNLLLALKFSNTTSTVASLKKLAEESGALSLFTVPDIIIPVPLHVTRLRERGFNQALMLARHCFPQWRRVIRSTVLVRNRATTPQSSLSGQQRRQNLKGCFQLTRSGLLAGKRILLVDDVFTTGSTINECSRILRREKPKRIEVFTLARSLQL